jgi:hypothetical protein
MSHSKKSTRILGCWADVRPPNTPKFGLLLNNLVNVTLSNYSTAEKESIDFVSKVRLKNDAGFNKRKRKKHLLVLLSDIKDIKTGCFFKAGFSKLDQTGFI